VVAFSKRSTSARLQINLPWPPHPPILFFASCRYHIPVGAIHLLRKSAEVASQRSQPCCDPPVPLSFGIGHLTHCTVVPVPCKTTSLVTVYLCLNSGNWPVISMKGAIGLLMSVPNLSNDSPPTLRAFTEHRPHSHFHQTVAEALAPLNAVTCGNPKCAPCFLFLSFFTQWRTMRGPNTFKSACCRGTKGQKKH